MSITAAMIDQREPEWVQQLKFGGAMVAVTLLDYGDLWVTTDKGDMLFIERKTATDFLASVADDSLWSQLAGLRQKGPWVYLVITGPMLAGESGQVVLGQRGDTKWSWGAIQGMLLKAQEMGVFTVLAPSNDFEQTVVRIAAHDRGTEVALQPLKAPAFVSPDMQLLMALPGIGFKRAQALLEYTGTAAWALSYLTMTNFGKEVSGIGQETKRKVREALGLKDGTMLSVVKEE